MPPSEIAAYWASNKQQFRAELDRFFVELGRLWRPDASVLGQRRPGALGPDRGFPYCQLASEWRWWRLRQQG